MINKTNIRQLPSGTAVACVDEDAALVALHTYTPSRSSTRGHSVSANGAPGTLYNAQHGAISTMQHHPRNATPTLVMRKSSSRYSHSTNPLPSVLMGSGSRSGSASSTTCRGRGQKGGQGQRVSRKGGGR